MNQSCTYEKTLREKLLERANAFCGEKNITLVRLSSIVMNNSVFFERLAADGDCSTRTYERFMDVFNRPEAWETARIEDADKQRLMRERRKARLESVNAS